MKIRTILVVVMALLFTVWGTSCGSRNDINHRINAIVKADRFSLTAWEVITLTDEIRQINAKTEPGDDDINTVKQYFGITEQEPGLQSGKSALQDRVERIIERQIRDTLTKNGIYNPFLGWKFGFPPVNFRLSKPPNLLVVSPREKIERIEEAMLLPDLSVERAESLEAEIEALGVSALVVPLGGLGATFPTFVQNNADLRFTIDTAAEEWLHQYLAFKPLGFDYVLHLLGITRNYDIVTINETVAGMVAKEIGEQVYDTYYAKSEPVKVTMQPGKPAFDFNAEMREIRKAVDAYLADGEVAQAEQYMREKRDSLETKGYYIRKLNQAYFAFYGSYADAPTSIDPIGTKLKEIREQSASLKDFMSMVGNVNKVEDLDKILEK